MRRLIAFVLQTIGLLTLAFCLLVALTIHLGGGWLVLDEAPVESDAIVLLSGELSRPLYGADLYREGYAPLIYISRPRSYDQLPNLEKLGIHLKRDEELYKEILLKKRVPEKAIRFYGRGVVSTVEEVESLREVLGRTRVRLIVVTSPYHTRRAKAIFKDVMPNAQICMLATPYEAFDQKWWTDQKSAVNMVLETAKNIFYHLGGVFRSTDKNPESARVSDG